MGETISSYRDLKIWQAGRIMVKEAYLLTAVFPSEERYGLVSQIRRCVVSIPANIAEGFARQYAKEYKQHLFIAIGSCAELGTHITLASDLGFCTSAQAEEWYGRCRTLTKMIQALVNKL